MKVMLVKELMTGAIVMKAIKKQLKLDENNEDEHNKDDKDEDDEDDEDEDY